jgi:hypothetical protein
MTAFSVSEGLTVLKSLAILVAAMVVYSVLIFNYYRFLARRDIVTFNVERYKDTGDKAITGFLNFLLTAVLYPFILCIWFVLLALILGFLGKNQSSETILLASIALISAVRVTAYYSEDLSRDLAKMLPFTLLGIFIVDQTYFNVQSSLDLIKSLPDNWHLMVYYFAFIFAIELVLRTYWIIRVVAKKKKA